MEWKRVRYSKSIVGLVAACLLAIGLMAIGPAASEAQAAETGLAADSGAALQTQAVKKYPIWVGGKRVTSKNAKNVLGTKKKTVTYNAKTNTLTLNGAKIAKAHVTKSQSSSATFRYGIYALQAKGLTIVLKGASKINVPGVGSAASYAISTADDAGNPTNLTIKGKGSLKAKAGKAGLFGFGIICKNLNIRGSAKVTAIGGTKVATSVEAASSVSSMVGSYGACAIGFLSLGGSAKLVASGKTKALNTSATYAQGYTPLVKAGASSKKISVSKKNPAASVYTKYKYVSISKAAKSTASKKPAKMKITGITPMASGLSVTFAKLAKNCTGYQLELTHAGSGKSWTFTSANTATDKAALSDLVGGATYTVRIRGVNKVGSKTYYGAWSAAKSTTTYAGQPAG